MNQQGQLGFVVGKTPSDRAIAGGFGSGRSVLMGAMGFPRGSRDHDVAGNAMTIWGERYKIRPFTLVRRYGDKLLSIRVPTSLAAELDPHITDAIVAAETRTLGTHALGC